MRTTRIIAPFCVALMAVLATGASPARAADAADDATGIALFNEGKQLASAGDWEHACPKFAEAQRLHPAAAILLNLALCYEHTNRLASAWGAWKEAEIMARNANDAPREQEAARRSAALVPQLAKLAIVVPPATKVPGLEVRKDGALVGEGQFGSPLPADVGSHTIEASAPGHKAWSTVVRVETNGSSASVEIPALEVLTTPATTGETPVPFWSAQRTAGVAVMALGAAGVVTGAIFGGLALGKNAASKTECEPANPDLCNATGAALRSEALTFAHVSTTGFVAGGAAVAGGALLFFLAPAAAQAPVQSGHVQALPLVGAGFGGVAVGGVW